MTFFNLFAWLLSISCLVKISSSYHTDMYTGLDWTHLLRNMVIQHEHPNPINPSKRAVEEEVTFNPTPCVALNVWQGISLLRSVIYISMWHIPFHSACLGSSGDTSCLFCILFATELCHFLDLSLSFVTISLSLCLWMSAPGKSNIWFNFGTGQDNDVALLFLQSFGNAQKRC